MKGKLQTHLNNHIGTGLHNLDLCEASFTGPSSLETHYMALSGDQFTEARHLQSHAIIQTMQVKPYKCKVCLAKFTQSGSLKKHSRIHSGDKPYTWEICSAKFTQVRIFENTF